MVSDRPITASDIIGPVNDASSGQKAALRAALEVETVDSALVIGLASEATGEDRLNWDKVKGLSSGGAGALYEIALQARSAAQKRADGAARFRLISADGASFSEGDVAVFDGEFWIPATPVPDMPATALEVAGKTNETAVLTCKNLAVWNRRTALAMSATPTIDWSGAETTPGVLDGHSLNIKLLANNDVALQVGAIASGLGGDFFNIVVQNDGGGDHAITVQDHATAGAKVGGNTALATLGSANGDQVVIQGYIDTTGTTNGRWVITSSIAVEASTTSYVPSWVDNNGSGWLSYDGTAIGADTPYLDMAFLVRSLNTNPSSACRVFQNHGPRIDVRFSVSGNLSVTLRDATSATLVDWTSTSAVDGAGEWLFHIAADLTGTPSFGVSRCELTGGVPGSWSSIPGTASTLTAGTIDNARGGFAGNELSLLAALAGGSLSDCDFSFLWWSQAAPLADSAFADGGVLADPAAIGAPVVLITGPVADLGTNKGSASISLTPAGTLTDI